MFDTPSTCKLDAAGDGPDARPTRWRLPDCGLNGFSSSDMAPSKAGLVQLEVQAEPAIHEMSIAYGPWPPLNSGDPQLS